MSALMHELKRRPIYGVLPILRKKAGLWGVDLPPFPDPWTSSDHYQTMFRWRSAMAWAARKNEPIHRLRGTLP